MRSLFRLWCAAVVLLLCGPLAAGPKPDRLGPMLEVRAGFPGGSAEVVRIDQAARLVRIRPARHTGRGWACWWYLLLTGIRPGEEITLEVEGGVWAWPTRAAFSLDDARWQQTPPGRPEKAAGGKAAAMVFRQKIDADRAWLAWGPPYLPRHAEELISRAGRALPGARRFVLCRTREDREVPALRIAGPAAEGEGRPSVWIQARQHAWESGSSWVGHGLVEWLISDDSRAAALRKAADVTFVPIMDVDNVVRGAGGKDQSPHDHNRDWSDKPHWPSVAAAMAEISRLAAAGRFRLFVDLHNPAAGDHEPFFFLPPAEDLSGRQRGGLKLFLAAAQAEMTGPLAFRGRTKVSGREYDRNYRKISKNWVVSHTDGNTVAVTLETSWNTPHSTRDNYRRVGRELGLGIERFLRLGGP